ncbi:MAG: hypothetical protein K9G48_00395 [Reyranella sp.]|nr:hypothetical protein [Reyranella sp.]
MPVPDFVTTDFHLGPVMQGVVVSSAPAWSTVTGLDGATLPENPLWFQFHGQDYKLPPGGYA